VSHRRSISRMPRSAIPAPNPHAARNTCNHDSAMPKYNDADFEGLEASEIKALYPRFHGACPDCGTSCILYSSWTHYIAGDW
jgi:hypothetical protein